LFWLTPSRPGDRLRRPSPCRDGGDGRLERLRAIDPELARERQTAVAKGETICLDIAKDLRWNQIQANAEATFAVGENEIDQILEMAQDVLCRNS
jgi:hypothetical protein